jgi:NAD(P)-dependent dehydrogenase (short-subunit alcohol dehydrogenase family)
LGTRLDLDGKVLFLAGVGPQMGSATALIAAREGAKVALAARTANVSEEVTAAIRAKGGSAIALQCDLTKEPSLRAAVDATTAALGPIWPDGISVLDPETIDQTRIQGPRQLTDIYLLALAVRREARFVTFDDKIPLTAVRRAKPQNLMAL